MSWTQPLGLLMWVVWGAFGISIIASTFVWHLDSRSPYVGASAGIKHERADVIKADGTRTRNSAEAKSLPPPLPITGTTLITIHKL